MKVYRLFITTFLLSTPAIPSAMAHPGHIAEVAGHSHVIVIGATLAAAALAGLVAWGTRKKTKDQKIEAEDTESDEVADTSDEIAKPA